MAVTGHAAHIGALGMADESAFGELSTTFDERLPVTNEINDIIGGLSQELMDPANVRQYPSDASQDFKLCQGGNFTLRGNITGHGSATTGAISETVVPRFLGRVIGASDAAQVGGTVNSPTSEIQFTTTGVTTAAGKIIRVGSLGDGDGEGQAYRVVSTAPVVLANAMAGTPVGAQIVYAPELVYPKETPTTAGALTSHRFQAQTANQRYNIFGAYPTGLSITGWNAGETLSWEVPHACAAWAPESSSTFPTTTSTDFFAPSPNQAGSLFINAVGTTTRSVVEFRDLSVNFDLQTVGLTGPGAPRTHQCVVGCRRVRCTASLEFTIDSETAGTDTWGDIWNTADNSRVFYHAMITCNTGDGQAFGCYFPSLKLVGQRPTQMTRNGLNAKRVMFRARTGATTTNDLTLAPFMLFFG